MSVALASPSKLPPGGRDFLVYQRVVVENATTRAAAAEFRLSQTRVRQIVQSVNQWLSATLPKTDADIDDAARLRVGQHIAADRLEYLYGHAMEEWRKSKQPKFAGLAIRIITAQAKVPAFPGTIEALAADEIEGPLPDEVGQTFLSAGAGASSGEELVTGVQPANAQAQGSTLADSATRRDRRESRLPGESLGNSTRESQAADKNVCPTSPPSRDCSPIAAVGPSQARPAKPASVANPVVHEPSGKLPPAAANARKAFFAPAQPSKTIGDDSPVTELRITPQQLGLSTQRLSRRDRRRLRRKLGA